MILNEPRAGPVLNFEKSHTIFNQTKSSITDYRRPAVPEQAMEQERERESRGSFINALVLGNREFSLAYLARCSSSAD
jgi:hypothetical protein